jgi:hypothetical protein
LFNPVTCFGTHVAQKLPHSNSNNIIITLTNANCWYTVIIAGPLIVLYTLFIYFFTSVHVTVDGCQQLASWVTIVFSVFSLSIRTFSSHSYPCLHDECRSSVNVNSFYSFWTQTNHICSCVECFINWAALVSVWGLRFARHFVYF